MKRFMGSVLLCGVMMSACCWAAEFYVSPQGSDRYPGTKNKPFATLDAARDAVRNLKKEQPITVWIGEGKYELAEPFVLNEKDSGTAENPVVWRAVERGTVHVVGGRELSAKSFRKLSDKAVKQRLSNDAAEAVYVADLKAAGITDFGKHTQYGHALPVTEAPLELFFNNKVMTLARYPNEGFMKIGKVVDRGSVPRGGDYSERGGCFEYTDDRHAKWVGQKDVWLQGTFGYAYADDKILVESIDPATKQVKLATPHMYGIKTGRNHLHYKALNILDEINEPSEWYLDRDNGKLYLWPPSDIKSAEIWVSMLEEPIICLEGVSHLVLRDLTVEMGRGIGIYMVGGEHNLIAGCTVRNMGTSGIFMGEGAKQTFPHITHNDYEGVPQQRRIGNLQGHIYKYTTWDRKAGKNHRIQSCDVYDTGCGGIYLSGGLKKLLIPGNSVVENCRVHDYNRRNKFLWSGINIDGVGNRIAHCEIFNSDFQAIYAHGNDHIYEYNEIHHVTLNSNDTSAWYLGRDPSDQGNVIRYNYFHHIGNPAKGNRVIYCDDGTAGVLVHGNVFYKMDTRSGIIYSNGGWDLTMENNIVVEVYEYTAIIQAMYYGFARNLVQKMFGPDGLYRQRMLVDLDVTAPPYSDRYPNLVNYLDPIVQGKEWEGMRPRRNVLRNNVIFGGMNPPIPPRCKPYFEHVGNFMTNDDPGFVDMANQNFTLKPGSEVFEKIPSFKPIPFEKMGLYIDEYRTVLPVKSPQVQPLGGGFIDSLSITMRNFEEDTVLLYRKTGDSDWIEYTKPVTVQDTTRMQFCSASKGDRSNMSEIVSGYYVKEEGRLLEKAKINFQDASAETPDGLLTDTGQIFGRQVSGYLYGWSRDNSESARLRGKNRNVELDSMVHFQGNITWEADVAPGRYEVTVVTGDSQYKSDNVTLDVEGTSLWNGEKLAPNKFLTKTVQVDVTDGRLTLTSRNVSSAGARVTRICSVEIKKLCGFTY